MDSFFCVDCGVGTHEIQEYYMVHDYIWTSVFEGSGMLCIGCLETRLERKLSSGDFTDCALNDGVFGLSDRLRKRINGD